MENIESKKNIYIVRFYRKDGKVSVLKPCETKIAKFVQNDYLRDKKTSPYIDFTVSGENDLQKILTSLRRDADVIKRGAIRDDRGL